MGTNVLYYSQIAKNRKGFSLVEILLVLAISSIVMLGNMAFLTNFLKDINKIEKESFEEADLAITNKQFANIIAKANLSFNRLDIKDDGNKNFFDYYPDMPIASFPGTTGTRNFTMQLSGNKVFYLLTSEEDKFRSITYDPMHSYEEGAPGATMDADGTVSFRGLNSIPNISSGAGGMAKDKLMSKVFNQRWKDGNLFVLSSPVYIRPMTGGSINLQTVPRMPSFIGYVDKDNLYKFAPGGLTVLNDNPTSGLAYAGLDNYFRTLPTVGGAAPFVKVEPARLYRFDMIQNPRAPVGTADLWVSYYEDGAFKPGTIIVNKLKKIRFVRNSVVLPLIKLEIEK